jgi:hypothetical protein
VLDEAKLEQRLAALERAVADLQSKLAAAQPQGNWLERVGLHITDEATFLEAMEYGRAFRKSDQPQDEPPAQP